MQKQNQQQKTTQKQKQRQVEFTAAIIAGSFWTEAQKLALSEKCLQSLSLRTLPAAASMWEANAEANVGMQKQRAKQRHRKPAKETKAEAKTRREICEHSCPGGHCSRFWAGVGASGANIGKRVKTGQTV